MVSLLRLYKLEEDYQAIAFAFRKKEQEIYDLKIKMKGDGDLYEKVIQISLRTSFFQRKSIELPS